MLRRTIWAAFAILIVVFSWQLYVHMKNDEGEKNIGKEQVTKGYTYVSMDSEALGTGPLILVNDNNPYKFTQTDELVSISENKNSSYMVKDLHQQLNSEAMGPLNDMLQSFMDTEGKSDILIASGYRSYEEQSEIYNNSAVSDQESQWVTVPGCSEHHTGYAVDFSLYTNSGHSYTFDGEGKYAWIHYNAYKYGFILRYPEDKTDITGIYYEPWHFRYVGHPHAYIIESTKMCLEEYEQYLKTFTFDGDHLKASDYNDLPYEIYFVESHQETTLVPVPEDREYYISGNNVDGYIVTIKNR